MACLGLVVAAGDRRRELSLRILLTSGAAEQLCARAREPVPGQLEAVEQGQARQRAVGLGPMDKPVVSLSGTIEALLDILGPSTDPWRLLRGNARRVYRLDGS